MSFESHKWSEKCTRSDLRGSNIQTFPGGACPQTPLEGALPCTVPLPPQIFSKYYFAPPLSIFLNETLSWDVTSRDVPSKFTHVSHLSQDNHGHGSGVIVCQKWNSDTAIFRNIRRCSVLLLWSNSRQVFGNIGKHHDPAATCLILVVVAV